MAPTEVIQSHLIKQALPSRLNGTTRTAAPLDLGQRLADAERRALLDALEQTGGHKALAAQRLGISRSQFYEKLKRHAIAD